jgi:hypothetical protein
MWTHDHSSMATDKSASNHSTPDRIHPLAIGGQSALAGNPVQPHIATRRLATERANPGYV